MWTWNADTPAMVPAGARISAGKSGCVARSLPNTADSSVNRSPTSCIPSPESPANLITTSSSVSTPRAEVASTVTVDHQLSQYLCVSGDTTPSGRRPRVFIGRARDSLYRRGRRDQWLGGANPAPTAVRGVTIRAHRGALRLGTATSSTDAGRVPGTRLRLRSRPRDAVLPAVRKNRRRTAPRTTSSSPDSTASSHAGGSITEIGADIALPSTRVVTCSCASRCPDCSTRTSGALEHVPRTMATLNDSPAIALPDPRRHRADRPTRSGKCEGSDRHVRDGV